MDVILHCFPQNTQFCYEQELIVILNFYNIRLSFYSICLLRGKKKYFEVQAVCLVIIFAILNSFWMNKLQFIKSKLRVLALFSPEFGESPSFLTEVKIQSSHSSTQKYSPLQRVIFPLLGVVAGETRTPRPQLLMCQGKQHWLLPRVLCKLGWDCESEFPTTLGDTLSVRVMTFPQN